MGSVLGLLYSGATLLVFGWHRFFLPSLAASLY
jgi:hypothetical protein